MRLSAKYDGQEQHLVRDGCDYETGLPCGESLQRTAAFRSIFMSNI